MISVIYTTRSIRNEVEHNWPSHDADIRRVVTESKAKKDIIIEFKRLHPTKTGGGAGYHMRLWEHNQSRILLGVHCFDEMFITFLHELVHHLHPELDQDPVKTGRDDWKEDRVEELAEDWFEKLLRRKYVCQNVYQSRML